MGRQSNDGHVGRNVLQESEKFRRSPGEGDEHEDIVLLLLIDDFRAELTQTYGFDHS